jgi:hypothetical protein
MKVYFDKSTARRAARTALGADAKEGAHFTIVAHDGKFGWNTQGTHFDEVAKGGPTVMVDEIADAPAEAAFESSGGDAEFDNRPVKRRKARNARAKAGESLAFEPVGEAPKAEDLPEPAPELPTAFVPDFDAGEIASAEYGMLTTRERAGEAAKAAGVSDPIISQTARGMWVWRTSALNAVWRESQKPPRNEAKTPDAPRAPRKPRVATGEIKQSNSPYRSNCIKAARRALGDAAKEGVDFSIEPRGQFWAFTPIVAA